MTTAVHELTFGGIPVEDRRTLSGFGVDRRVLRSMYALRTGLRRAGRAVLTLTERRRVPESLTPYDLMTLPGWGGKRP